MFKLTAWEKFVKMINTQNILKNSYKSIRKIKQTNMKHFMYRYFTEYVQMAIHIKKKDDQPL